MSGRVAILAGATGLVGREILRLLLADASVAMVHALGRRAPDARHPKLVAHVVDFAALPALPVATEAYLALGTTIRVAGSQAAFRAVDLDANLAVARASLDAGARRVGLVSAMGASVSSPFFYSRVKGELEDALAALRPQALVIARPALLAGDRAALNQPGRAAEGAGLRLASLLRPLLPADWRPIAATAVARALVTRVPAATGRVVLSSGLMGQGAC